MFNKGRHFYEFGPFRLDPDRRTLQRQGQAIPVQPKALEILLVLIQNSEKVVLKDDLLKTVWPDTFVEESNLAQNIFVLRKTLGDAAGANRYIITVPGRGYRFAERVQVVAEEPDSLIVESHSRSRLVVEETSAAPNVGPKSLTVKAPRVRTSQKVGLGILCAGLLLALLYGGSAYLRKPAPVQEADLILISDFVNTTGEPIFDDTLKQAVTVKMAESPYFNVALDGQTRKMLGLMNRSPDERVVPPIARDVCQREGAKAVVGGSIMRLGDKYVLDLDASNCLTGISLVQEKIEAANREQVLRQLGQAIIPLRRKLGESIASIQKFDTPIEQATTKSLAALKAYTDGDRKRSHGQDEESIPSYKMAIDLDPEFAIAYARLGAIYINLQQYAFSDEYLKKAFERREHVSEREKLYIQAHYYVDSTHEIDKAIETYELWTQIYSHDWIPFNNLSNEYQRIGDHEKAVTAGQQALHLNPNHGFPYAALSRAYQWSNRFAEAKAVCEKANEQKLDSWNTHTILYDIALMEGDEAAEHRESDWFRGNALESWIIRDKAQFVMSSGNMREGREAFAQARKNAAEHNLNELAGSILQDQAQFEADLGFSDEARKLSDEALRIMPDSVGRKGYAALILASIGDVKHADVLAEEASRALPADVLMNKVTLAAVRAFADLNKKNPAAAIAELQSALPYDFSTSSGGATAYYRGNALLQMRSAKDASTEFQKILDNRGAAGFYWPLAHVGLARAFALSGEKEKSLAAYRNFFELWNHADPDIPVLKQAKAEFAKLEAP